MYWLFLPVAAVTLFLGLRTPSMLAMLAWLAATAVLLGLWAWFRFREVFPDQNSAEIMLTPMNAEALRQMRAQAEAERASARGQIPVAPNPFATHPDSTTGTQTAASHPAGYGAQPPLGAPDPFATRPAPQAPLPPSGSEARGTLPSAQSAAVPSSSIFSNASRAKFDIDDNPPA